MIALFIRAEFDSPRFGGELRSTVESLGMSVDAVVDGVGAAAADDRRRLLAAYRGWGQYESVFGGLPDDVRWFWAWLDEVVLRERVLTIVWYFREAFGTRRVSVIGDFKRQGEDESRARLARVRAEGRVLEPPILLAEPDLDRLVILEGHSRILSYMAHPDLVTFPIRAMIGISERMAEWSEW